MIRVEVIEKFDLKAFNELKNIKRAGKDVQGSLFVGDTFECTEKMVDYLTGNNAIGKTVVKVIEVEPETAKNTETIPEEYKNVIVCSDEPKPKKNKKSKK